MLKAIIFDMDGVIIDSEPQHAQEAMQVFKRHGADADYDYCASFIGSSTRAMTEDAMLTAVNKWLIGIRQAGWRKA